MIKSIRAIITLGLLISLGCALPLVAEPFAVRYTIEGFLVQKDGRFVVNDPDGRVFELLVDAGEARTLLEKYVRVEGKARRADDTGTLKVQKIAAIPEPTGPELPVAHADYQRPVTILQTTDDAYVIKDVRWGIEQDPATSSLKARHEFVTATVKPELLEDAYFILKPFFPRCVAGHTLFCFTFKKGGVVCSDGRESPTLALTIEAYKKIGQTYGLIKTLKKSFEIVWELVTWANYATLNVKFNTDTDKQLLVYPFRLTREQKVALLKETIKQCGVNRKGEFYHTTRNNCTNNLAILLNRVLPPDRQLKLWTIPSVLYNVKTTMPVKLINSMIKKGLIGEAVGEVTTKRFTTEMPPN